ncbi:MAG: multicopper oxidase domain-containing protein, partial [Parvibaculum sp.]
MGRFKQALTGTASAMALLVGLSLGAGADTGMTSIALDPADMPPPIARDHAATIKLELETIEREAELADGTTFRFWTFNGTVPGPFVRARVGDTVEVAFRNAADSTMFHSVDFHAVTGPGGGG